MNPTTRSALACALMGLAVVLGVVRFMGLFGNPLHADGALLLVLTLAASAVVIHPYRSKDHSDG